MTKMEGILSYLRDYIAKCKENMRRFLFLSVLLKFKNIKKIQINQKMNITSKWTSHSATGVLSVFQEAIAVHWGEKHPVQSSFPPIVAL